MEFTTSKIRTKNLWLDRLNAGLSICFESTWDADSLYNLLYWIRQGIAEKMNSVFDSNKL